MTAHMEFDVKLDAVFTCKSIFFADEHKVDAPPSMTYNLVVSIDSVKIVLMLGALNGLNVKCYDV